MTEERIAYGLSEETIVGVVRTSAEALTLRCFRCDWGMTVSAEVGAQATASEHVAEHEGPARRPYHRGQHRDRGNVADCCVVAAVLDRDQRTVAGAIADAWMRADVEGRTITSETEGAWWETMRQARGESWARATWDAACDAFDLGAEIATREGRLPARRTERDRIEDGRL